MTLGCAAEPAQIGACLITKTDINPFFVKMKHNMPHVFEVADRVHIHRLDRRLCVVDPKDCTMSDAVSLMTGAMEPPEGLQGA